MNKVILLCLILAFATTTFGDCSESDYDDCLDVSHTCLKECPASQECDDYVNGDLVYFMNVDTHPCGKCGEECLVDERACLDKCDPNEVMG